MSKIRVNCAGVAMALAAALGTTPTLAAETITYSGTGTYDAVRILMPLASGGATIIITARTTATVAPSEPGFLFGQCTGLAYVSDKNVTSTNVYCTFTETGDDSFDIHAKLTDGKGGVDIVGGSGKWKGSTGTGKIKRKFESGSRGSYSYEFKISTP